MNDMEGRLRRLGGDLDAAAPAITADEVLERGPARPRLGRRWALPIAAVAAAVMAVAGIAVSVGLDRDDDTSLVLTPGASSTTEPSTSAPSTWTSTSTSISTTTSEAGPGALPGERQDVPPAVRSPAVRGRRRQ